MSSAAHDSLRIIPFNIAADATASDSQDVKGHVPVGIITPPALTSPSAEVQASIRCGRTYVAVYGRDGTKYSLTPTASRSVAIPPGDIAGLHELRLVVGTAEAAARTLQLVCRSLG